MSTQKYPPAVIAEVKRSLALTGSVTATSPCPGAPSPASATAPRARRATRVAARSPPPWPT